MKKILLVVDIQKGFIVNEMTEHAKKEIDKLLQLDVFDVVLATQYENFENSPISILMGWNLLRTKEEQQLVGETNKLKDHVVVKQKYSAVSEELIELLKNCNDGELPETVFVVGVDTECCVLMTATDLFERGIRPIVLTHYCASSGGKTYHDAGILSLHHLIGKNNLFDHCVFKTSDLEDALINSQNTSQNQSQTVSKEEQVVSILKEKGYHISFAESCTAGMAAARLVNVSDASKVFDASHVTYANFAKMKYLGVLEESIREHGVVSEVVALEMAKGTAARNGAEVGVGISGIAGPNGGTAVKPVGMVCFGFVIGEKEISITKQFGNIGRNVIREASVEFVYDTLLNELKN